MTTRPRVALAGASGHVGQQVSEALVAHHELVVLTRSPARAREGDPELAADWQHCDFLSRSDVGAALAGARFLVYLVHSRLPSARLDQMRCDDMDLLIADNFGAAAAHHGLEQIVCLQGPLRQDGAPLGHEQRRSEIVEGLGAHGVPVTAVHAGMIFAPGGTTVQLLRDLVCRPPVVVVPGWASSRTQPIAAQDVAGAIRHCVGRAETYGQSLAIGGPQILSVPELFTEVARAFGRRPRIARLALLPPSVYAFLLGRLSPSSHPALVRRFVEELSCDTVAEDNALQRVLQQRPAIPPQLALHSCAQVEVDEREALRRTLRQEDDAWLRKARTVRSIQRFQCPAGQDAHWLADRYFLWLPRFLWPFIVCERDAGDDSVAIALRLPRVRLLQLTVQPEHSGPGRRLYFITGGALASRSGASRGRMEFRDVQGGRYTIVAIHDYVPLLPWNLYHLTQAAAHGFVMWAFKRHLVKEPKAQRP